VVLAYGEEPWLDRTVRAILDSTGVDVDVVLVDNGCTSDAVDQIKGTAGVRVIRPDGNTGYSGGCHVGADEADGDYLAFVNSDAIIAPDALRRLADVVAEPGVGLAMGSVRLADDPDLINTAGNPVHYTGISWAGGFGEPASAHAQRRTVPVGSGCFFAMTRERWREMGGFPAEYFAYHEDTELSLRLWQRDLTVEYVPDAVAVHHYEYGRNTRKSYLLERNRLLLLLTTYQRRTLLLLAPMLLVTEALMVAVALAGRWPGAKMRGWGWLWRHRAWVRDRRRRIQSERRVPDRALIGLFTAELTPSNVPAPPGIGMFNFLSRWYWSMVRRFV
jgi:GT2 family glycosyltransferase